MEAERKTGCQSTGGHDELSQAHFSGRHLYCGSVLEETEIVLEELNVNVRLSSSESRRTAIPVPKGVGFLISISEELLVGHFKTVQMCVQSRFHSS